jgi:hypothetical protein
VCLAAARPDSPQSASLSENLPNSRPRPPNGQKAAALGTRPGSKTAAVLDLLKRPDAAILTEIMTATGLQLHSVRGFISGIF